MKKSHFSSSPLVPSDSLRASTDLEGLVYSSEQSIQISHLSLRNAAAAAASGLNESPKSGVNPPGASRDMEDRDIGHSSRMQMGCSGCPSRQVGRIGIQVDNPASIREFVQSRMSRMRLLCIVQSRMRYRAAFVSPSIMYSKLVYQCYECCRH
jgi:hypothetical protein